MRSQSLDDEIARGIQENFASQALLIRLGAELTHVALGCVKIEVPITEAVFNQHGFAHAGLAFTIGDTAGGYAAMSYCEAGADVMTVEFKVNFLAPGVGQRLKAVGQVIRPGKRISVVASNIFVLNGDSETKIAVMQGTMLPLINANLG